MQLEGTQSSLCREADAIGLLTPNRLGYPDLANAYRANLSGGREPCIAIARAMALEPKIILIEKLIFALDPMYVGSALPDMRELGSAGMAMRVVSREMRFAGEVAGRMKFVDGGPIMEEGPPTRSLASPRAGRTNVFTAESVRWLDDSAQ